MEAGDLEKDFCPELKQYMANEKYRKLNLLAYKKLQDKEEMEKLIMEKTLGGVRDTTAPQVFTDKGGGLFSEKQLVNLLSNDPGAKIFVSLGDSSHFKKFDKAISLSTDTDLYFYAEDSLGNRSNIFKRLYRFNKLPFSCPGGMAAIEKKGGGRFCMDLYEWPNQKGKNPRSFVSWYQASDSCQLISKRLCSSVEWESACRGPHQFNFPYGYQYEAHSCNSQGKAVKVSGSKSDCRSYYGLFDLSGNLREWTSTHAPEDKQFFKVMGGYFKGTAQTRCNFYQYSFYPQNQANTVGFRCCSDP